MSSYAESLAPKAGFWKISEQAEIRSSLPLICTFAGTTCSTPTSIEHANIQVKSYNENSRERYICNSGFKRKAGTSSLTKCLRNEDTNITQWTIPTLICIRDPSLTRQRPSSTVAPAGVTPEPETPSPSGKAGYKQKAEAEVLAIFKIGAVLKLLRWESNLIHPSNENHQVASPSSDFMHQTFDQMKLYGRNLRCEIVIFDRKQTSQTPSDQVENMEDIPMTGGNNGREEDTENYHTV
ncbi:Interleukin-15 receptor subunit alpha [Myotis davidii]|uniref:Interleukin-15 receptor subunit alpha n=1 Tax=Myotis davidii TaxID=225400 RepID=L5LBJ5_MYODS|nr:Interleukin-15 receptor subunit alpha [Myotis davidii]